MSRYLLVDIGAGTMDVLYYDGNSGLHYKAVVKSPVRYMAEKVANIPGNLLITGNEMGGGPVTDVLTQRAQEAEVLMTPSAAATIHHNLENVRSRGIQVVENSKIEERRGTKKYTAFDICDLDIERLRHIVSGFGVPFAFDVLGVCAQDHGMPPDGLSHLDYRHKILRDALNAEPYPQTFLYAKDEVPATLNRLTSIAASATMFPTDEVYLMDSGMAAILGASMDPQAKAKERILILDVATSHTLGAALEKGEIAGFFEYHTRDINLERLDSLLVELAEGQLEHKKILEEGGHGAFTRKAFGFQSSEIIVATGPKRRLAKDSRFPIFWGAPFGDNMMTGAVGMLEAIRRRKRLKPIQYV